MKCPYCTTAISHEALVCPTCRRDLYIARPLLARIAALEAELAALPEKLQQESKAQQTLEREFNETEKREDKARRSIPLALCWWLSPLLLLLLGHWLTLFVYDLPVIYLRVLALVVPIPFGFLFARALRAHVGWGLPPAFLMALLSVCAMGGLTAWIDQVPALPQNMLEMREFIEFAASIGFSFITGLWLCHWQMRHDERKRLAVLRSLQSDYSTVDDKKLTEKLARLNDMGSGIVALLTTGFAIYTGLKRIIG